MNFILNSHFGILHPDISGSDWLNNSSSYGAPVRDLKSITAGLSVVTLGEHV